ncbi:MAG TPA: ATP-grasp domain-containing protein [Patescibacteria group bacterium]|nr:ATP-grasp domain-containing protein [Patescibacteria group bacterium]
MKTPLVFVTRDIERALAMPADPDFYTIANQSEIAKIFHFDQGNHWEISSPELLDTWQLLQDARAKDLLSRLPFPQILVFKNTPRIEKICTENNWKLLNPSSVLASRVEEKISQLDWLEELKTFLPPYQILTGQELTWDNTPYIIQFNRSHTGSGTILVSSAAQLAEIKKTFPQRLVRTAPYIPGPLFTNNTCVAKDAILFGNISYQITGLEPFTDRPFATIGNDWGLPQILLTTKERQQFLDIAAAVGKKLQAQGWRGLFGIDVVKDERTNQLYLLEINARQPASTTFESLLQKEQTPAPGAMTIFEAHLRSLREESLGTASVITINQGAQIIQRVTKKISHWEEEPKLPGVRCLKYKQTTPGNDLLRFQTPNNLLRTHNELNETGLLIRHYLEQGL